MQIHILICARNYRDLSPTPSPCRILRQIIFLNLSKFLHVIQRYREKNFYRSRIFDEIIMTKLANFQQKINIPQVGSFEICIITSLARSTRVNKRHSPERITSTYEVYKRMVRLAKLGSQLGRQRTLGDLGQKNKSDSNERSKTRREGFSS